VSVAEVPAERVVFGQSFEGLFVRGLKGRLTPRLEQRLKEIGLDLKRLATAYPLEVWTKSVELAAQELHRGVPRAEAYRLLGERVVEGFAETFLGNTLFSVLKLYGPTRAMHRTTRNFRSANNYTEARVTERKPGDFELWMNETGDTRWVTQGVLVAALRRLGATELTVDVTHFDEQGVTFDVKWKA
jgi:uncharacterized protein (TIGR02265 family)